MKKELIGYAVLFIVVLAGSLAFILPGVEAADQYKLYGSAPFTLSPPASADNSSTDVTESSQQVSQGQGDWGSQPGSGETENDFGNLQFLFQDSFQNGQQTSEDQDRIAENIQKLEDLYRFIDQRYIEELDHDVMYEAIVNGLFEGLDDPYSSYFTEEEASDLMDTATGVYGGIGAYISKPDPEYREEDDPESYMVTIVAPFPGSPAAKAGLHAGNLISHIDGDPVNELTAEQASNRLRGEPDSKVVVTVYKSEEVSYDVTITRKVITVPTVQHEMIDEDTAYLKILQFTPITPEKVKEAIQSFRENGYKELVLDVRYNPGGDFGSVREIADFFLDEGIIVITESRLEQQNRTYKANPFTQVPKTIPMTVLIDEGSASASEILAGALRDNDRAVLIGSTTFGKGLVQGVYPFGKDYFKITISKYLTPDGTDINEVGIEPDITAQAPELSDEESKTAAELMDSGRIEDFVDEHEDIGTAPVDAFVEELQNEGFDLSERHLHIMIRNEFFNRMDYPPIYDLEYDIPLNKALDVLKQMREGTWEFEQDADQDQELEEADQEASGG